MSDGLSAERAAISAAFQKRTLRRSNGETEQCGVSPGQGRYELGEGRYEERGAYTITIPGDSVMRLNPGERVTIDEEPGRVLRVVWTPIAGNLRLSRRYGADEGR